MVDTPISKLTDAGALTGEEVTIISQLSTSVTISAATISAQASDNSFNDSGSGFVAAGFALDDYVYVEGFTGNAANNIFSGKITALTTGKMTIGGTDGDVIVDDAAGETVTISKWVSRRMDVNDLGGGGGLELIDSHTFAGSTSTHTFSSIPGTYKDLVVVFNGRSDRAGQATSTLAIRLNGDTTAANYYTQNINASSNVVNASATAGAAGHMLPTTIPAATAVAGYAAILEAIITRYAGTTFQKMALADSFFGSAASAAGHNETRQGGHWLSTSAVTSLTIFDTNSANFTSGSTVEIYGRG